MSVTLRQRLDEQDALRLLDDGARDEVAGLATVIQLAPGDVLVDVDAPAPGLVYVAAGRLDIVKPAPGGDWVGVDSLHPGAVQGRLGASADRASKVRLQAAETAATLELIDAQRFAAYLASNPSAAARMAEAERLSDIVGFLRSSEVLSAAPKEELWAIAREAEEIALAPGERLIRQGAQEDWVFIVREGRLAVAREEAPSVRLTVMKTGDIVGEMAVLSGEPRTANVDALEAVRAYRIQGGVFRAVMDRQAAFMSGLRDLMAGRLRNVEEEAVRAAADQETAPDAPVAGPQPQAAAEAAPSERRAKREAPKVIEGPKRSTAVKILRAALSLPAYPAIRQHSQMDCSAACLVTVAKYYGKTVSLNVAREMARVRQDGASMTNVMRAAHEMGFKTEAFISSITQLREKKLPCIANWKGYHWIVVYEVTDSHVSVADPAEGLVRHPIDHFVENWSRYTIFLEPTEKFAAFPESKPSIAAFFPYFRPHKRTIWELFAGAVFLQVLALFGPLFGKFVVDEVILKADAQWLTIALMVMIVVLLLNMVMDYITDIIALNMTLGINYEMISDVYRRLLRLPLSYFEVRQIGDVTNRLEQHEEITQFITEDGLDTFINLLTAVAFTAVMFYLNAWLAAGAIAILFLNIGIVRFISPRVRQLDRESFVKEAAFESHTIESMRGAMTLKTLGADHQARWKYEEHFAGVTNLQFKEAKLSQGAEILAGLVDSLSDIIVLFIGGLFVMAGELTIGGLVAFTVLANGVQDPINALIGKWDEIQEVLVAVERLNDVREKEPEYDPDFDRENKVHLPSLQGHFQFRNVTFRYEDDDPDNVVQGLSLTIEPGQKVAFVGPSGCGKSTIIKLLFGFYKPKEGTVLADGFDYADIALPSLRRQIAMVPQESLIFRGSVRDNIAMARAGATLEEVVVAAKKAEAHDFITKMPGGYEAELVEQGANLSGGQKQRINLARAFLRDAPVLVLDEATSALDVETERVVMETILDVYADRTVLMIAHRLSTVRKADLIVVLNDGLIVEQGTHEELIEARGFYYHLSARQMAAA
ncbi:MAG: peptidase domain-containing ABC transporter [Marivibrio sp.]|uniref:peptidase domain-containing ABC transporter n=1 Tax=Marivibrio sp. TaxID=2039719 RepID=UPI0032EC9D98